jgi:hypothetical protein
MEKLEIKDIQNLNPTATYKFEVVEEQKKEKNKPKQIIEYVNLGLTLIAVIELLILII